MSIALPRGTSTAERTGSPSWSLTSAKPRPRTARYDTASSSLSCRSRRARDRSRRRPSAWVTRSAAARRRSAPRSTARARPANEPAPRRVRKPYGGARVGEQRGADAAGEVVEPPPGQPEQVLGARQVTRRGTEVAAGRLLAPRHRGGEPAAALVDAAEEIGAHRDGDLRGRGRRGRAAVGGEIDQRRVGLVPDAGDQRDRRCRRRADHDLLVEGPEVLEGAAAAGDDDHVRPRHRPAARQRVEAGDRSRDFGGRGLALHPHRPDDDAAGEAVGEAVEDVADHGAGRRGDDADDARQEGQRLLALRRRTGPRRRAACCALRAAPSARRRQPARSGR